MPRCWPILVALALCLGVAAAVRAPSAEARGARARFVGYVEGRTGPTHLIVLDPRYSWFPVAFSFTDRLRPHTRYRVCWRDQSKAGRCWTRTTGARGARSRVAPPKPANLGAWLVRWYVNGRPVASWKVEFASLAP
jgi:hypothetical protein